MKLRLKLLLVLLTACQVALAQTSGTDSNVPRPGGEGSPGTIWLFEAHCYVQSWRDCGLGPCDG
jgi:hypothetical protein